MTTPMPELPIAGYLFSRPGISKIDVWPHGGEWEKLCKVSDAIAAIEAHHEGDAKDAERYRWLRELPNADSLNIKYMGCDLDMIIDSELAAIASKVQTTDDIHSCSFFCELPACIKRQRDEMRDASITAPATPQGKI